MCNINIFIFSTVTCGLTVHAEHITAFPMQQWLHKLATMLHYSYTTFLGTITTGC
jgi:hypothetical protein